MTDVVIPSPGESITEVTLGSWHRRDGEWVEKDDLLCEIESDKATLELLAPAAGLFKPSVKSGSEQRVGAVVAKIDEKAPRPSSASNGGASAAKAKGAGAGDGAGAPGPQSVAAAGAGSIAEPKAGSAADPKATSVAKKLAADRGIDLARVEGTGPGGRVTREDVEKMVPAPSPVAEKVVPAPSFGSGTGVGAGGERTVPAPSFGGEKVAAGTTSSRGVRRERVPRIRQRIAERLVAAQHTAAMLTTFNECDMSEVMRLRTEHKDAFEKRHGVGLGFMSFFVRAAVSALEKYPKVNAYLDGEEFEFHDYCDVAVAVGTDRGLVVPVLRNAESMTFADVERTIRDLATRARDGKLSVDEMTGGTFTITNGGIYGSLMSTPILNTPQAAILGMHAIKKRAVEDPAHAGQIALRPMMYLALSYDHRIIDGSEAVSFLAHVKESIEKPERLLIGL